MRHWIRTFVALVRVEVRGLAPAALGLAACVLLGLVWARFFGGLAAPLGSPAWIGLFVSITVLVALPLVGLPFDGAGPAPVTGSLRPLPVRGHAVLLAKLAATMLAVLCTTVALAVIDAPLALLAPTREAGRVAGLLGSSGYIVGAVLCSIPALSLSLIAAAILESALASTILGLAVAVSPLLLASGTDFDDRAGSIARFAHGLGLPLSVVLGTAAGLFVVHALCSRTLRGRRSRSVTRRLAVASTFTLSVTAGLAAAAEVGASSVRRHAESLTWENDRATLSELNCESGKRFALVKLMDRDSGSPAASYWTIDRTTLEVARVTLPHLGLAMTGRHVSHVTSPNAAGTCFAYEDLIWKPGSGRGRVFECAPGTEPGELTLDAYNARADFGRWRIDRGDGEDAGTLVWYPGHASEPNGERVEVPRGMVIQTQTYRSGVPVLLRDAENALHVFDPGTRRLEALGWALDDPSQKTRLSPGGRWLQIQRRQDRLELIELQSGRSAAFDAHWVWRFNERERPLLVKGQDGEWRELGLDGEHTFELPPDAYPHDLDGERWLVLTHPARGLFVHDADGRRIRTLRPEVL